MQWIEDIPDEFYREISHNLKKIETYINSETKRLKEEQDDEDSDEPTNILQFPKIFH